MQAVSARPRIVQTTSKEMAKWLPKPYTTRDGVEHLGFENRNDHDFKLVCDGLTEALATGRGLFVVGNCGNGKTVLMRKLFNRLNLGREKMWADCTGFDEKLWVFDKNQNKETYRDIILNRDVFIDDLGKEVKISYGQRNDFMGDFIFDYCERNVCGRLFGCSNNRAEQLLELYDERVYDRLLGRCVIVRLEGKTQREGVIFK